MKFAGKTLNMYRLTKEDYICVIRNTITIIYRKASIDIKVIANQDGKHFLESKVILSLMEINRESNCFIILIDHTENLVKRPTIDFINLSIKKLKEDHQGILLDQINLELT